MIGFTSTFNLNKKFNPIQELKIRKNVKGKYFNLLLTIANPNNLLLAHNEIKNISKKFIKSSLNVASLFQIGKNLKQQKFIFNSLVATKLLYKNKVTFLIFLKDQVVVQAINRIISTLFEGSKVKQKVQKTSQSQRFFFSQDFEKVKSKILKQKIKLKRNN